MSLQRLHYVHGRPISIFQRNVQTKPPQQQDILQRLVCLFLRKWQLHSAGFQSLDLDMYEPLRGFSGESFVINDGGRVGNRDTSVGGS